TAAGEITLPVRGSSRWAASTRVTVAGDCASRWPPGLSRASSRRVSFFIERLPSSSPAEKMIYYIFRLCYYVHRSNATSGPPDCAALEVRDQQFGCLSGVLRWKPAPRLRRKIEAAGSMSDRLDHACKQHGSEESQQCQHRSTTRAARLSSLQQCQAMAEQGCGAGAQQPRLPRIGQLCERGDEIRAARALDHGLVAGQLSEERKA